MKDIFHRDIRSLRTKSIKARPDHLPMSEAVIGDLAASMRIVGQRHPVQVRFEAPLGKRPVPVLLDGHYRLAAAKLLGWEHIDCEIRTLSESEERMRDCFETASSESSTAYERALAISEWVGLAGAQIQAEGSVDSRTGLPRDAIDLVVRDYGRSRKDVEEALLIATIDSELEQALISAGVPEWFWAEVATTPASQQMDVIKQLGR